MKETLLQRCQREAREKFESLKCVNGAMFFGTVEATCPCGKTRCSNEQTQEEAEAEYTEFLNTLIADTLKQAAEALEGIKTCNEKAYRLPDAYVAEISYDKAISNAQKILVGEDNCPSDCDGQKLYTKCPLHGDFKH